MASNIEEDEEEVLVYVDFTSRMEDDYFTPDKDFKIIGLDEDRPVLQLGNHVFQGEWQDSMGTHLFFEASKAPSNPDPVFAEQPEVTMKYAFKADKVLHMSRIFLNSKNAKRTDGPAELNEEELQDDLVL